MVKYLNKPIYTCKTIETISGMLAYNLQHNKIHAKIIGDKTYGAANPVKNNFIAANIIYLSQFQKKKMQSEY
jgi:hypothetical protein